MSEIEKSRDRAAAAARKAATRPRAKKHVPFMPEDAVLAATLREVISVGACIWQDRPLSSDERAARNDGWGFWSRHREAMP